MDVQLRNWGRSDRNYPVNCWWVAAPSSEVAGAPLSRWMLDQPVVLYRKQDGGIVALEDRCAHRAAPLSAGKIAGDDLVCPYHGFRYDASGRCVRVPSQEGAPGSIRVRAFPARELAGFIWLWMGDPALCDEALLPDIPWFTDPALLHIRGDAGISCNYMMLQENLLDPTHFAHLHANTLQQDGWETPASEIIVTERTVEIRKHVPDLPLAPFMAAPMGLDSGAIVQRTDWGIFHSPACHFAGCDIENPAAPAGGRSTYAWRILHCATPSSHTHTHYWWAVAQDYGQGIPALPEQLAEVTIAAFNEDKYILEEMQKNIDTDYRGAHGPEVSVVADRAALQMRRIIAAMVRAELAQEAAAAAS